MPIRALIFDFDGLILDTETVEFEGMCELYRQYGQQLQRDRWVRNLGTLGKTDLYAELAELTGLDLDLDKLRANRRERYLQRVDELDLRPGLRDMLDAAQVQGLPLAVASSSSSEWVLHWLNRHNIRDYFACVRTRDDVQQVKPAPDLFLSAAAGLNTAPEHCIVFEDSPNGMLAAAAAGMRCVAVPIAVMADHPLPPVALKLQFLSDMPLDALLERLEAIVQ